MRIREETVLVIEADGQEMRLMPKDAKAVADGLNTALESHADGDKHLCPWCGGVNRQVTLVCPSCRDGMTSETYLEIDKAYRAALTDQDYRRMVKEIWKREAANDTPPKRETIEEVHAMYNKSCIDHGTRCGWCEGLKLPQWIVCTRCHQSIKDEPVYLKLRTASESASSKREAYEAVKGILFEFKSGGSYKDAAPKKSDKCDNESKPGQACTWCEGFKPDATSLLCCGCVQELPLKTFNKILDSVQGLQWNDFAGRHVKVQELKAKLESNLPVHSIKDGTKCPWCGGGKEPRQRVCDKCHAAMPEEALRRVERIPFYKMTDRNRSNSSSWYNIISDKNNSNSFSKIAETKKYFDTAGFESPSRKDGTECPWCGCRKESSESLCQWCKYENTGAVNKAADRVWSGCKTFPSKYAAMAKLILKMEEASSNAALAMLEKKPKK